MFTSINQLKFWEWMKNHFAELLSRYTDMNYLLKFVACSKLVDNLIEYFEPTGAINTITMNEKKQKKIAQTPCNAAIY